LVELKDLLAGQRHAATVGAMKLGGSARIVPLAKQPYLQLRLAQQLIPAQHLVLFVDNQASPAANCHSIDKRRRIDLSRNSDSTIGGLVMREEDRHDRTTASHSPAPSSRGAADGAQAELIDAARGSLTEAGEYLVFSEGDLVRVVALIGDWTRIGRSTAADVRFDDPTVSRRHALIIREGSEMTLVDDSSLNGIFVAGERIDRYTLGDGDSFLIGRYRMNFVSVTTTAEAEGAAPPDSLPV
jgi:hypothetical protein